MEGLWNVLFKFLELFFSTTQLLNGSEDLEAKYWMEEFLAKMEKVYKLITTKW